MDHQQLPLSQIRYGTYLPHHSSYAEKDCYSIAQQVHFKEAIISMLDLSKANPLRSVRPMIDPSGLLRVGGRQQYSQMSYSKRHPIILHHKHINSEHLRLLHAGSTLLTASLCCRYHLLGRKKLAANHIDRK